MILSACSPFFQNILRRNPHSHPLLYMKGVKYSDLQAVLNFMYHGEVSVAQEDLNSFLSVAEDLRVKGLTQNENPAQSHDSNKQRSFTHKTRSPVHSSVSKPISRTYDHEPPPPPKRSYQPPPNDEDDIQEPPPPPKRS